MKFFFSSRISILFLISTIVACSDNADSFIDEVKVNLPDAKLSDLSKSYFTNVKITEKQTISGFTSDYNFSTKNLFKTFTQSHGGISLTSPILHEAENNIVLYAYDGGTFELSIMDRSLVNGSLSYAKRFKLSHWEEKKIGEYYYRGEIFFKDAFFITKEKGWIVARYVRGSNGPSQNLFPNGIRVYEVNNTKCAQISVIEGSNFMPVDVYFKNELEGYIIAQDYVIKEKGYFFKTTDGGKNWTNIYTFSKRIKDFFFVDDETFLVTHERGFYQSNNSGSSWNESLIEKPIATETMNVSLTTDNILYAAALITSDMYGQISCLYISEDKGITWNKVQGNPFYGAKIYFLNKDVGIAYSGKVLQYTDNGGRAWKLLSYSFKD